MGGTNAGHYVQHVDEYDPALNVWSVKPTNLPGFSYGEVESIGSSIYILGGTTTTESYSSKVYEYNPVENSITQKADMGTGRILTSSTVNNGKIMVIGGADSANGGISIGVVEQYNPVTNKWSNEPALQTARRSSTAQTVDNRSFVFGGVGVSTSYTLDSVEVFTNSPTDPVQPQPSGDRAILTITLTNGVEKEYDLSMTEVTAFLDWYDLHSTGSSYSKFAINKQNKNKGPFTKRTEYVIHNKILIFEINEYKLTS
ncbi:hypothetical protein I6N90_04670 [Paenibacillus sp. GSMTC-2017]|uniref:Kelch repeat-containing protein n=1 Tax=Paenibacillus sp. GSMTC-2017 TaxID=2794350 RepID=UPI0018D9BC12|nr:kelch repeat-containing protein [Paenibacillus sp. GSMTC-2017]MBH5317101.1 hypothetical protein [Paenibacillus sp. GSMTC-2017]